MSGISLFGESLAVLAQHKLRTLLTIFGIMWGIAAFTFGRAVLEGFQSGQRRTFDAIGKDLLIITGGRTSLAGPGLVAGRDIRLGLADAGAILGRSRSIGSISVEAIRRNLVTTRESEQSSAPVHGVWPAFQQMRSFQPLMGRLLALADEQDGRRVCILGYDVARQLLGETLAIPTSVRIGGLAYTVVGVTRKKVHGVVFNESDDRRILIPFRAMTRDFPDDSNQHGIRASLLIQPVSVALHEELLRDIRETLAARHRFSLEDPDALVVFDTIQTARAVDGVFAGLARFGDTSSLMTVLLGSIGLTNILLTSVRERIREIGIRRSVGARNLQIFTQFLGEGLMLAATGGLAGLAAGGGLALLLGMISIPGFAAPVLRPAPALAACGIVGITGILASIYPAWKAVKIDPAEALRHA